MDWKSWFFFGSSKPGSSPGIPPEKELQAIRDDFARKSMRSSTNMLRLKGLLGCRDRREVLKTVAEIVAKGIDADRVQVLRPDWVKRLLAVIEAEGRAPREFPSLAVLLDEPCILSFLARRAAEAPSGTVGPLGIKEGVLDPVTQGL